MTLAIPRLRYDIAQQAKPVIEEAIANPYKISSDYGEFLRSQCRIRSGNKVIPFLPYEYQTEIARIIDSHRGVVVIKTRQMGFTECVAAKFLHKALLNPAYAAVVLSMGQSESSNVAVRIQNMPAKIPDLRWVTKSKMELQPLGCGKVWFRPSTDNAARSLESVSDIFIDEHAFIDNAEELYASAAPTQEAVGEDARTIIASTISPSGEMSTFWQMFSADNNCDAREMLERVREGIEEPLTWWVDKSGWAKVILHWKANPVYSAIPDYLEKTKREKKLTDDKLQREYNLGLPMSGGKLFPERAITQSAKGKWEKPQSDRVYVGAIDPNFGGADFFTTEIYDVTEKPYRLVAEYHECDRAVTYSIDRSINLFDAYNPIAIAVESNSGGTIVAEKIIEARSHFDVRLVNTNARSKVINTDRVAILLEQGELLFPSDWIGLREMRGFSLKDRRAIAGHDDCVMCCAIASTLFDEVEASLRSRGDGFGVYGVARNRR
jgi:hypothetical protein